MTSHKTMYISDSGTYNPESLRLALGGNNENDDCNRLWVNASLVEHSFIFFVCFLYVLVVFKPF